MRMTMSPFSLGLTHFLGIGKETGKRRVFSVKNGGFIGDFEAFGAGNEEA